MLEIKVLVSDYVTSIMLHCSACNFTHLLLCISLGKRIIWKALPTITNHGNQCILLVLGSHVFCLKIVYAPDRVLKLIKNKNALYNWKYISKNLHPYSP